MSKNKNTKMTPFEKTKQNLKVFCENLSICESAQMLAETVKNIEFLEEDEREAVETILEHTIGQLSSIIEERDSQWN